MPNYHSPENEAHFREVKAYIENEPDPDYQNAPDSARQAFLDTKYGIRVIWGLYTLWNLQHESWPFLKMSLERRQQYQQLYRRFNPTLFNAE